MIKISAVICCVLVSGCVSGAETVKLDRNPNAKYLDKASLETVIIALQNLQYPLTRDETLDQLHLTNRQLPSLTSTESESYTNPALFTNEHETIDLTDPDMRGRRYTLLLWYDPVARKLSGESFVKAKIINYAEILVEDDGSGDAPKARYVVQSSRYPYVRLEYPGRSPTKK